MASTPVAVPERHLIVRERTFPADSLAAVLSLIHAERAVGTLSIDIAQGSPCAIRFSERTSLDTLLSLPADSA